MSIATTLMNTAQVAATRRLSTEITSTTCMMGICIIRKAMGSRSIQSRSRTPIPPGARPIISALDTKTVTFTVRDAGTNPSHTGTTPTISSVITSIIRMAITATITVRF
jgi:hypothetical protein